MRRHVGLEVDYVPCRFCIVQNKDSYEFINYLGDKFYTSSSIYKLARQRMDCG